MKQPRSQRGNTTCSRVAWQSSLVLTQSSAAALPDVSGHTESRTWGCADARSTVCAPASARKERKRQHTGGRILQLADGPCLVAYALLAAFADQERLPCRCDVHRGRGDALVRLGRSDGQRLDALALRKHLERQREQR